MNWYEDLGVLLGLVALLAGVLLAVYVAITFLRNGGRR